MFNSPILNLVILLSFTYFIGSLMLSAINEFIAAIFRMRQNHLKEALGKFFFSNSWKVFIDEKFIKSPQIQSLMKAVDKYPAYISASNFVSVLIEQIGPANFNTTNLSAAITASTLPQEMKTVLATLLAKSQNKLEDFEKELEKFYDEAMDRVTGWYKRKVRTIMFFVGIALSVTLNIDTLKISNDALSNPERLDKIADNITTEMSRMERANDSIRIKDASGKVIAELNIKMDTTTNGTTGKAESNLKELKITYEQTTGYQLGYKKFDDFVKDWQENYFEKIMGILITVFALQLGANYWFDLLNKFINLRAAGKKPEQES